MKTDWNLNQTFCFEGREVRFDMKGAGAPLVLVHGTPWSSFNLRHLIEALSGNFEVYYYDLLGYGQSDKSAGDVSLGLQNRLLEALLDHWHLSDPYVAGHDFGGTTVLRTHILNGRAFRKIALIDPVALSPWGSAFFKHIERYESAFADVPDYIYEAIVAAYVKTAAYQSLPQETLEGILCPWLGVEGKPAFYRQIAQADAKFTAEVEARYAAINTPVLILWGEEDQWIPLEQGRRLQKKIPGSVLHTIPNAGHLVIEEKPDALASALQKFFNKPVT